MATTLAEARALPAPSSPEGELFHYTPEEAARWLPWKPRVLRMKAAAHEIPHNRGGARITFTGRDIREISEMTAIRPLAEKKRRPARRAPAGTWTPGGAR